MGLWDATKTVLGNDVQGLVNMFKLPGDVYSGKKNINDPNVQNEAIGLGTNIALGMRPMDVGAGAAVPKVRGEPVKAPPTVPQEAVSRATAPEEPKAPEPAASSPDWKGWEVQPAQTAETPATHPLTPMDFKQAPTTDDIDAAIEHGKKWEDSEADRLFGDDAAQVKKLMRSNSSKASDNLDELIHDKYGYESPQNNFVYGMSNAKYFDREGMSNLRDRVSNLEFAVSDAAEGKSNDLDKELAWVAPKLPDINMPETSHSLEQRTAVLGLARALTDMQRLGVDPTPHLKAAIRYSLQRVGGDASDATVLMSKMAPYIERYANVSDAPELASEAPKSLPSPESWKGWEVEPQAASAAPTPTADILKGTVEDNRAAQPGALDGLKKAAQNIQGIFAPETLSPEAGQAAGAIRQEIGRGTRVSEQTKAALQQYQKQVNAFSPQDKLDLIDVIQSGKPVTDEVDPLVSTIKKTFDDRRAKLEALPATEKMDFIENYYPQQWKNPEKARQFAQQFGTKEGNKGFAKKRTIPTMADGIRAGLEPITTDPIDGTLRYVENVDRYIGINNVFDRAVDDGMVSWRAPGNEPEGWQKVEGRQSQKFPGRTPTRRPVGLKSITTSSPKASKDERAICFPTCARSPMR